MYEQRLPIEEWKFQKQKERNDTIAAQKKVLQEVVQDGQRLADYLYGRGRLGSHITSGNAALVLQTLPQARAVLTAKDWDKFGRRVNKGAKGIPQLVRVNGYYNVGSIFDVSMTYGNKPYPIPEIKPEQMDKAIKELERLSPVNIIFQNEGVVGYDAEQHAIVFPTAMPQREVLARLPAEIVIATAEQHTRVVELIELGHADYDPRCTRTAAQRPDFLCFVLYPEPCGGGRRDAHLPVLVGLYLERVGAAGFDGR